MNKILLLSAGLFALTACNNPKSNSLENADQQVKSEDTKGTHEKALGGDADEHGCLSDAGQSWSELKQSCIQIFDEGERLNPVETKSGEAVISAFAVFNDDKSKVELFVPNEKSNVVLDKSDGDVYQNETYKLVLADMALYIKGDKKYVATK